LDVGFRGDDQSLITATRVEVKDREQSFSLIMDTWPKDLVLDPDVWLLFEQNSRSEQNRHESTGWEQ
jgi:hypothetical protein